MKLFTSLPILLATSIVSAQDLRPVYDARLVLRPTQPTNAEMALLKREVLPVARRQWQSRDCNNDGGDGWVTDVAAGAFTRRQADQKAVLYTYCTTGHNFANNGIAIVEKNYVVKHLLYENSWEQAIGALPDLNQNGLSEILVKAGGTNQGITWQTISLIELTSDGVKSLGQLQMYEDDCGVHEKGGTMTAYKLFVKPGLKPVFYRDTFKGKCEKGDLSKVGSREQVNLEKDETDYLFAPGN